MSGWDDNALKTAVVPHFCAPAMRKPILMMLPTYRISSERKRSPPAPLKVWIGRRSEPFSHYSFRIQEGGTVTSEPGSNGVPTRAGSRHHFGAEG